jgi:hypothetical protein
MKALYKEELKDLQNKKDLTIICEGKKEFKCSKTILKRCSEYFEKYDEMYPGKSLDFSEGEIIFSLYVVIDSMLMMQDLKYTQLLMEMPHEKLVKIMIFYQFLLIKDPVVNKISLKLKKYGYTPAVKDLTYEELCKTWDSTLIESKLAKFVRIQILSVLIKNATGGEKHMLGVLLKNHINNNKTFKDEYETVRYLM